MRCVPDHVRARIAISFLATCRPRAVPPSVHNERLGRDNTALVQKAPITCRAPTMANSTRMAMSTTLVTQ